MQIFASLVGDRIRNSPGSTWLWLTLGGAVTTSLSVGFGWLATYLKEKKFFRKIGTKRLRKFSTFFKLLTGLCGSKYFFINA